MNRLRVFVAFLLLAAGVPAYCAEPLVREAVPCAPENVPATATRRDGAVALNIADRGQPKERPTSGWCGESAIQQALLFNGAYIPQKIINQAGKPAHEDLYAGELAAAVKALGFECRSARNARDLPGFMEWIRDEIKSGNPVLLGVKVYPTQHPEWSLDHFVLAPAFDKDSFTLNTTWGRSAKRTVAELSATTEGLALENRHKFYFGFSLPGPLERATTEPVVRLFVTSETSEKLAVIVKCEALKPGADYIVCKAKTFAEATQPAYRFKATSTIFAFPDTLDADSPVYFRCRSKLPADGGTTRVRNAD